jgi:pyruvate formate lyase activating enzyme
MKKICTILSPKDRKNVKPKGNLTGMIHSFETFGALDGPGLRLVIFFEGCPLRCAFCHNRDMLDLKDYKKMTAKDLMKMVQDYKPYFGKKGGVTVSGGDPIYQPRFLKEFLKLCKKEKVHVAVDTSLFTSRKVIDDIFPYVDLFMVSLKHFDSETHRCLTGVPNEPILENLDYLNEKIVKAKGREPKLWLRYMVLPGYTDTRKNVRALMDFLQDRKFELIDLLPYHVYGVYKWKQLGLKYILKDLKPPSGKSVRKIKEKLEKEGYKVLLNE